MRAPDVPREFIGQARQFRQILSDDDVTAYKVMSQIRALAPLVRTGQNPRPALLAKTAATWRNNLPTTGRLRLEIDVKPKSLKVLELRVVASDSRFDDWEEGITEPGVSIVLISLEISTTRFRFSHEKLSAVSLHAAARWVQRSIQTDRSALLRDLTTLAAAADDATLLAGGEFEVPAGDGKWVGVVTKIEEDAGPQLVLSVRTYLS